jgi:hypothetical protein
MACLCRECLLLTWPGQISSKHPPVGTTCFLVLHESGRQVPVQAWLWGGTTTEHVLAHSSVSMQARMLNAYRWSTRSGQFVMLDFAAVH